ncbi:triosephosphate isomerase [Geothermobacter ehrlichii]|uniref:Triosephosphate isomerase n=1 Tax=Geothermobacter ehrlichii TaxID=213224 RepID=A0A5D3WPV3_9BACT|nr:triose-phosphate isomerase [Geothermobacter ehrlichii]TYO99731.1 triosephosphate isomerase [Geothermobacter ehrlichii]
MRKPIIAGNWKMHKTIAEATGLAAELAAAAAALDDVEVIVAPPFTALAGVVGALPADSALRVAAQNCYCEDKGAFTGEIAPSMLVDAGCSHVILGHSERRKIFGENDALINRKVHAALAAGLNVILCIGETLEEREQERMYDVLKTQVSEGLKGLAGEQLARVVIAYEPVWAIGTGRTATSDQAEEAHSFVRGLVGGLFGQSEAEAMRILYGGSVKPENIDGLMARENIDGALVGGASLQAEDFIRIMNFARSG